MMRSNKFGILMMPLILLFVLPVQAQDTMPPAPYAYRQIDDPAKEAQALALMHTLRCLVCDGQSIADSDAPMAGDMRSLVRTRIAGGESPDAVRQWLIERYGAMISYDPPRSGAGLMLWLMPLLLAGLAGFILIRRIRRRG
jgi:cytochrome c-type biogenesis protein CcmH